MDTRHLIHPDRPLAAQDPWSVPAQRVAVAPCAGQAWVRPLANGDQAVLVLNRANASVSSRIDFEHIFGGGAVGVQAVEPPERRLSRTNIVACGASVKLVWAQATWVEWLWR
eukprot:COSAG01_NODE_13115_length_1633_cov_2.013038_3_plen_111_part_01